MVLAWLVPCLNWKDQEPGTLTPLSWGQSIQVQRQNLSQKTISKEVIPILLNSRKVLYVEKWPSMNSGACSGSGADTQALTLEGGWAVAAGGNQGVTLGQTRERGALGEGRGRAPHCCPPAPPPTGTSFPEARGCQQDMEMRTQPPPTQRASGEFRIRKRQYQSCWGGPGANTDQHCSRTPHTQVRPRGLLKGCAFLTSQPQQNTGLRVGEEGWN